MSGGLRGTQSISSAIFIRVLKEEFVQYLRKDEGTHGD